MGVWCCLFDTIGNGYFQLIVIVSTLIFTLTTIIKNKSKNQRQNLQIKWNAQGKDVVILHMFPRARYCPNPSPYPLKLETFLRIHKIKYVTDFEEPMSDKDKSPWITINGENIADSQIAMDFLTKKFNLDSNPGLGKEQLIISRGLRFMIEQDLYWVMANNRWVVEKGQHVPTFFAPLFPKYLAFLEPFMLQILYSKMVAKQTYAQGIGRHTIQEQESMGLRDIQDLSDYLGDNTYLMGTTEPTEIDCVLFGFIVMFLYAAPKDNVYVQSILKNHQNLVKFVDRMKEKYWPDWEDCCYKDPTPLA